VNPAQLPRQDRIQFTLPDEAGGHPGPHGPADRLPDVAHRPAGQTEPVDLDDHLVADLDRVHPPGQPQQPCLRAGRQHRRAPALPPGLAEEGRDRVRPAPPLADRVAGGHRDPGEHPVGDRGAPVRAEGVALVEPQRERRQRVRIRVGDQAADLFPVPLAAGRRRRGAGDERPDRQDEQQSQQGFEAAERGQRRRRAQRLGQHDPDHHARPEPPSGLAAAAEPAGGEREQQPGQGQPDPQVVAAAQFQRPVQRPVRRGHRGVHCHRHAERAEQEQIRPALRQPRCHTAGWVSLRVQLP
jgi:hypothetical protein